MQPVHIDRVLTRIVVGGAPTVANDALRYMSRMFRMAVRNHWIDRNPAADFDLVDAGGDEASRDRWLTVEELQQLALAMRTTPNYGHENELAVWLLLTLCVRKTELLSASSARLGSTEPDGRSTTPQRSGLGSKTATGRKRSPQREIGPAAMPRKGSHGAARPARVQLGSPVTQIAIGG